MIRLRIAPRLLFALFVVLVDSHLAHAAPGGRSDFLANLGSGISRKADERYQTRWTLADWFETQRQKRLQDMWLAGNKSDDLYEFYIGGQTGSQTVVFDEAESSIRPRQILASAGAYATLVGLEGQYLEVAGGDGSSSGGALDNVAAYGWEGLFAFRPLGDSLQNSNLTLFYGIRFRDEAGQGNVQNSTAKVRMTLYLTKAFGLEGHYQWIFKSESNQSADVDGSHVEGSLFLDFSLLRIFGAWSQDNQARVATATGVRSERKRESIDVGLKLFF